MNTRFGICKDVLDTLQGSGVGRPFLAGIDEKGIGRGKTLTVHAAVASMSPGQSRNLAARLKRVNAGLRVKVKRHPTRTLERARSLQAFLQPFDHQQIVFDPTGVFDRGARLVELASSVKHACGTGIRKCQWHSPSGTLFVVADYRALSAESGRHTALAEVEKAVRNAMLIASGQDGSCFVKSVHVSFQEPGLATVPVDIASAERAPGPVGQFGWKLYISSIAAALGLSATVAKADDPVSARAVSRANSEFAIMGGEYDDDGAFIAEGALTVPLGDRFGARLDGAAGGIDGDFVGGTALHMFWRNPNVGLAGLAAGYLRSELGAGDAEDIGVVAGEGEVYFDKLTVSALAGYEFYDDSGDDGFVGRLDLEFYPDDDLLITTGVESNPAHDVLGRLGVEYLPGFEALPGLSLFAEGAVGEEGYQRAFGGVRFYFGPSTTLKERQRHDTFRSNIMPTRMMDSVEGVTGANGTNRVATGPAYGD